MSTKILPKKKTGSSEHEKPEKQVSRRGFLKGASIAAGAAAAATFSGCKSSESEKNAVQWGLIIDLQKCVGCKSCTVACKAENHTPPGVAYNVVMEEEIGKYPHVRRTFISRPCMHCRNSSCTTVCPTGATYHRKDGIVAVNYKKCIGCRYCIAACPYGARSFDYGHDYHEESTPFETFPSPEYGQNTARVANKSPIGNVRKCTFCLHRIKKGLAPACASTCLGKAIYFGNMNSPDGKCLLHGVNLQELLVTRSHMRLKEELGNNPRVYYLV